MIETIEQLQQVSHQVAASKGWHDLPSSNMERLCLIHTEISEAAEEIRVKSDGELGAIYWEGVESGNAKPLGFAIELADAMIRIAHLAQLNNIDLTRAINVKTEYNKSRSYRHGGKTL